MVVVVGQTGVHLGRVSPGARFFPCCHAGLVEKEELVEGIGRDGEDEPPAGPQNPPRLGDYRGHVGDVLQDGVAEDGGERAAPVGEAVAVGPLDPAVDAGAGGLPDLFGPRVYARVCAAGPEEDAGNEAIAATQVQQGAVVRLLRGRAQFHGPPEGNGWGEPVRLQ
jgi:hypothetical protein